MNKKSYLLAPIVFLACAAALALTWAIMDPSALHHFFDQDGYSPFELATIPFYAAIIPMVWWKCPFTGSKGRRTLLCAAVSCVAFFAVCKELDLHLAALTALWPDVVADFKGTPFKMRFLTKSVTGGAHSMPIPILAKVVVVAYFALFFGVFAALLAYFSKKLFKGFFKLHPVAWSVCFLGGSGVMVQLCDRMPAWVRHAKGLPKEKTIDAISSFFTAFEEGGEMMIAIFALLAICQAHRIYSSGNPPSEFADL
ncbi:MAG: hypothetical protein MJ240_01100 [Kiritimatiellae bacterium]|nr:hypothetical protein [Kiritimatiellia bacterium]